MKSNNCVCRVRQVPHLNQDLISLYLLRQSAQIAWSQLGIMLCAKNAKGNAKENNKGYIKDQALDLMTICCGLRFVMPLKRP